MIKEPTLECIWEARRRIYAQCGHDPVKLVQYYITRQKANSERFTSSSIIAPKAKQLKTSISTNELDD
jgi:hypothetical protein